MSAAPVYEDLPSLAQRTLDIALTQNGVHEVGGNNCGPQVNEYLKAVGLGPGYPWCCAFIVWCIQHAARTLNVQPEFKYGASVYKLWTQNQHLVLQQPEPGCVVLINHGLSSKGQRIGHALFCLDVLDGGQPLKCISGNTNAAGSREGDRVVIQHRPISQLANGYGFIRIA